MDQISLTIGCGNIFTYSHITYKVLLGKVITFIWATFQQWVVNLLYRMPWHFIPMIVHSTSYLSYNNPLLGLLISKVRIDGPPRSFPFPVFTYRLLHGDNIILFGFSINQAKGPPREMSSKHCTFYWKEFCVLRPAFSECIYSGSYFMIISWWSRQGPTGMELFDVGVVMLLLGLICVHHFVSDNWEHDRLPWYFHWSKIKREGRARPVPSLRRFSLKISFVLTTPNCLICHECIWSTTVYWRTPLWKDRSTKDLENKSCTENPELQDAS